jgi:hypothetical protein
MRPFRPTLVAVVTLAGALLPACGAPVEPQPLDGAAGSTEESHAAAGDAEAIGFGEALAQIRGHHVVSLELLRAGDRKGAVLHAGHPIEEILASVSSELGEHDPEIAEALSTALEKGVTAVSEDKPVAEVEAAFGEAAAITEQALNSVVGPDADAPAYRGSVIAALLGTAAHEYEEAVGDDGVRLLAEYQDGYGFAVEANRLYSEIEADVTEASAEEAEEIDEAFAVLEDALPSPEPPAELIEVIEVTSAAELIGHELEETVGAAPTEESDPEEVVAEIEKLLGEIVATYKTGDEAAAAELAAEAYLENYEVIEAEVIEQAPEVNEELEPLLGADLRRQITAGAPVEDIEKMTARAEELLAEALEAIAEH